MPRKSIIKGLPSSFRKELDRLILEEKLSTDQLRDFIARCDGVEQAPCRSSVGDYAKQIRDEARETAAMLRQSREMARGIAQELGPESVEGEQGRLLVEMLRTFFFRFLHGRVTDPDAVFDSGEFAKMAKALRDTSQAMRLEQDFATRIKEEARKEALSSLEKAVHQVAADSRPLSAKEILEKVKAVYRGEA